MIYLTRRERFSAAHRLFNPALSDQENLEQFGPCANPNWHGHNYVLWVTIKGKVNPETGYVVDLKMLSQILKEQIINKLNTEIIILANIKPTIKLEIFGVPIFNPPSSFQ